MIEETEIAKKRADILSKARAKIGTPYNEVDCSHFVQAVYEEAGLKFPYTETRSYKTNLVGKFFLAITENEAKPGDLILFSGHVGIFDPDGCSATHSIECKRLEKQSDSMRVLSARSGKNMGVEYGQAGWWANPQFLVWKEYKQTAPS